VGLSFVVGQQVASVTALLDTGADVSLMSFQAARRMNLTIKQLQNRIFITQADQTLIEFSGYVEGHLFLAASGYPHRWLVPSPQHTKLTKQDLIIGCDVMAHIWAAVFDFSRQQIRLRDRTRKVDYLFEMSGHNKCIIKTHGPKWWALGYADPRFGWPEAPPPPPGGGGDDGGNGGDDDQGPSKLTFTPVFLQFHSYSKNSIPVFWRKV
jgi:hypothetical protein